MRPGRRARVAIGLVAAVCLAAASCSSDRTGAGEAATGSLSPASEFDLDQYKGKVVVLNFWATWCGPCRLEIPDLVRLRRDFRAEDVAIIGISLDQYGTEDSLRAQLHEFITRYGINYPVFHDYEWQIKTAFDRKTTFMDAVPVTLVLDQQGRIYSKHLGVPHTGGRLDPYGVLGSEIQKLLDDA